ncbi:MAG TPA: RHS repeat-associated core domain-containing protein [Candidatus Acidoferrum sp.]|nr:RHS repeat-associated core domain-containing protein [Candidatus Acidoferrum sp.]
MNKSGSPYSFQATYSSGTNRITCIGGSGQNCTGGVIPTYDSNGNVTNDGFHNYTWDADGHAVTVDSGLSDAVSLTFDALGRMVEQNRSGTYTQIAYSPTSRKLALMSGQTLQKATVPLAGSAFAVYNSGGLLYYSHPDMLGSIRLATTPARGMYFDTAYAPFGETYASTGTLDPAYTGQMNDTAHRQDTAGGLYDFPAREYSTQGRWPSPDPLGVASTCLKDPQSQDRYAYVRNNPISYIDPQGLLITDAIGTCQDFFYSTSHAECGPMDLGLDFPIRLGPRGGGGGGFTNGGAPSEKPRRFPWPQLPLGFLNAFQVGGSLGLCDCILIPPGISPVPILGWARGLGCSYLCECPNGISLGFKKCSILAPKAFKPCPVETQFSGEHLINPPDFCGDEE